MAACPYHVRVFNWWDPKWPEGMENYLSPDVSCRMRGVVEKCSFCFHRLQRARNQAYAEGRREIDENEYQTACTQACPADAITFGDLENPEHKVYTLKQSPNAFRLLEILGTNPKVYYVSSKDWVRKAADVYVGKDGGGVKPA
jgi:molybdopterin-containing oxidoreductase family iron-sulfur binding subunit